MIDAAGKSDIGRVRTTNQDAYHIGKISTDMVWSVVCDGMGGANGGNVASLVAVGAISAHFTILSILSCSTFSDEYFLTE